MSNIRIYVITSLIFVASATHVEAKEYSNKQGESVNCYHNGQLIFETRERLRAFQATSRMTLMADISTGQVQKTVHKLFANEQAGLVCVVKDTK